MRNHKTRDSLIRKKCKALGMAVRLSMEVNLAKMFTETYASFPMPYGNIFTGMTLKDRRAKKEIEKMVRGWGKNARR